MMHITVTGRHFDLDDELKAYASEKTSKLERYFDRVQNADVVFDVDGPSHRCEIIVRTDHQATFVAKELHDDAYACFDAAVKDLEEQLRRHKERHRNRKHPSGHQEPEPMGGGTSGLSGE